MKWLKNQRKKVAKKAVVNKRELVTDPMEPYVIYVAGKAIWIYPNMELPEPNDYEYY